MQCRCRHFFSDAFSAGALGDRIVSIGRVGKVQRPGGAAAATTRVVQRSLAKKVEEVKRLLAVERGKVNRLQGMLDAGKVKDEEVRLHDDV